MARSLDTSKGRTPLSPPKFRDEAGESDWWNSPAGIRYAERSLEQAIREGTAVVHDGPITAEFLQNVAERARKSRLKAVSIRMAERDIEDARYVASEEGIPYQAWLKRAIRRELDMALARPKRKRGRTLTATG